MLASICFCYLERLDYAVRSFLGMRLRPALSRVAKQISSTSEQGTEPPRSLKATVAAFAKPQESLR